MDQGDVLTRQEKSETGCRHLVVVLGDQLDLDAAAFDGFDPAQDAVWMAEVLEESTHVWSSQVRTAYFLAAMRHFAQALRARGWPLHYQQLDDDAALPSLKAALLATIAEASPTRLIMTAPGDWRVWQDMQAVAREAALPLDVRDDRHFFSTVRDFSAHARGRKQLRLEFFYREMRQRHCVLMEAGGKKPLGGQWNFDVDNREAFGAKGPPPIPPPCRFVPDATTQAVVNLVRTRLADHPGTLDDFGWPVTREQALQSLHHFIAHRLPQFGRYQDAMWPGEPWLFHAHLSAALNLKLLNPREVVAAAELAYHDGAVPLASAEGFIRQILGWREYVRGVYWTHMPEYLASNALDAHEPLPSWYWTGQTDMACLRDAITQTLRHGYAHHIQRLMVTGLYALLLGVEPQAVHRWYLAVYVDAVEWVELPNTLGMSQYADGGVMASKPYIATGRYIERMGQALCKGCRFDPGQKTGERACPFTTLYWDFMARHEAMLAGNPRLAWQVRHLARMTTDERNAVAEAARALRANHPGETA